MLIITAVLNVNSIHSAYHLRSSITESAYICSLASNDKKNGETQHCDRESATIKHLFESEAIDVLETALSTKNETIWDHLIFNLDKHIALDNAKFDLFITYKEIHQKQLIEEKASVKSQEDNQNLINSLKSVKSKSEEALIGLKNRLMVLMFPFCLVLWLFAAGVSRIIRNR